MNNDLKTRFEGLSNEDFIRLVALEASNYNQEELEIMKEELSKRNIEYTVTRQEFKTVKSNIEQYDTNNMRNRTYIEENNSPIQDKNDNQVKSLNLTALVIFIICVFIAMMFYINYTSNMIIRS